MQCSVTTLVLEASFPSFELRKKACNPRCHFDQNVSRDVISHAENVPVPEHPSVIHTASATKKPSRE